MSGEIKKTILLVEDDAIIAMGQQKGLEKFGYTIICVDSGEEALSYLSNNKGIDLVLMDIDLGDGIDGSETAEKILKDRDIPIVFLSSHIEPEIVEKTEQITSYGYVVKNSTFTVLDASIKMAFKLFDSNQKTKDAEIMYRNIFLNAQVGIFRTDMKTGLVLDANECLSRFAGFNNREELMAESYCLGQRYVHSEDREKMISLLQEKGSVTNLETQMIRNDGSLIWIRYSARIVSDKGWIEGVAQDVTRQRRMQEELRDSEESLAITLNSIGDAVIATDTEGRIIRMNPVSERLTGWCSEEAKGKLIDSVFRIINAKTRLIVENPVRKVVETGTIVGLANHTVLLSKNGKEYQIADSGAPIKNGDGKISGVVIVFRDVTEEYVIQENLRLSEEKYRLIFENAPLGFVSFTDKGIIDACNENFLEIIGSERDQLIGLNLLSLPDERIVSAVETAFLGETGHYEKTYHSITSQKDIPVRVHFRALCVGEENIRGGVGIIEDITERKNAEDALRESEKKFSSLAESVPLAIMIFQGDYWVYTNPAGELMSGYSSEELYKMHYWDFIDQKDLEKIKFLGSQQYSENEALNGFEFNIVTKKGEKKVVYLIGRSIEYQGKYARIISVSDITERKEAEDKIKALLTEKELILKEVHHRIKNNMSTINSLLFLQAGTLSDPVAVSAMEDAANRVQSMMVLYDKLYQAADFTEMSMGQYLPCLVDEISQNFPTANSVTIHKKIDDFVVDVKKLQMVGIIVNELLTNIMKYAFQGKEDRIVTICASVNDNRVTISIEDNGNGIPDTVTYENSKGFGLVLINGLTKQLKGTMRTERNNGTRNILEFTR